MGKKHKKKKHSEGKEQFSYNAVSNTNTRKYISSGVVTQDEEFKGNKRQLARNVSKEVEQNFALIQWLVNTHLDFISTFTFQATTKNAKFNKQLEKLIERKSFKKNIDISKRNNLETIIRIFNALKILDGDSAIAKINDGRLQLISAWQIAKGKNAPAAVNENGLILDDYTAIENFCVCDKQDAEIVFKRLIAADDVIFDGFFKEGSQTRGTSPLLSALNHCRDLMQINDYYLLKLKLAAIFGVVLFRDHSKKGRNDFETEEADDSSECLKYNLSPGMKLELDKDEKAEFLESKTPPAEFINFSYYLIKLILTVLQMPFSIYDGKSDKNDWQRYRVACKKAQKSTREALYEITDHILTHAVLDGEIVLPKNWTINDIEYDWLPSVSFILDRPGEVEAALNLIKAGMWNRQDACIELGLPDVDTNIEKLSSELKKFEENNIAVDVNTPGAKQNVITTKTKE